MLLDHWKTGGVYWDILIQKLIELHELLFYNVFHNYYLEGGAPKPSPRNVVALQTISKDLGINYQ